MKYCFIKNLGAVKKELHIHSVHYIGGDLLMLGTGLNLRSEALDIKRVIPPRGQLKFDIRTTFQGLPLSRTQTLIKNPELIRRRAPTS